MLGFVLQSFSREEPLYDRCFPIAYDKLLVPYPVYHMQIVTKLGKAMQCSTVIIISRHLTLFGGPGVLIPFIW
jgi:hypothetical protein